MYYINIFHWIRLFIQNKYSKFKKINKTHTSKAGGLKKGPWWLSFRWTCAISFGWTTYTYICSHLLYWWCFQRASKDPLTGWLDEMLSLVGGEDVEMVCTTLWPLREQEGKEGGDEWRWVVPAARTAGEAHSGLPACLIYSTGRALCTPHHLPFCPLAVCLHSVVDAEKVRGHRADTGIVHIWLSVGVFYSDGKSTGDMP